MSWKIFAGLAAIAFMTAPAVAQPPSIGLEDRGGGLAALTITTGQAGAFGTNLQVSFSGGVTLVDSMMMEPALSELVAAGSMATSSQILDDPTMRGIDDLPFETIDPLTGLLTDPAGVGPTTGLAVDTGSIFASVGLADQGVRTFDLLTFNFEGAGTITAAGAIGSIAPVNFTDGLLATLVVGDDPAIFGDFDGDGDVDGPDFVVFAENFALNSVPPASADADFDGDGFVNGPDFVAFAENFAAFPPAPASAAVPEPSALVLSLVGLAVLGKSRRS